MSHPPLSLATPTARKNTQFDLGHLEVRDRHPLVQVRNPVARSGLISEPIGGPVRVRG
jgi:hypothetical protein